MESQKKGHLYLLVIQRVYYHKKEFIRQVHVKEYKTNYNERNTLYKPGFTQQQQKKEIIEFHRTLLVFSFYSSGFPIPGKFTIIRYTREIIIIPNRK